MIQKSKNLPRLAKRTDDSTFDRIYKYFFTPKKRVELTPKENEQKERWEHIWHLLCGEMLTDRQAVLMHKEKYNHLDERTCYKDLFNSRKLFGNARNGTKEQKRAMLNEWLTRMIQKADAAGDFKAAEKLILRYSRVNGLDATENPMDWKDRNPVPVIITADAAVLEQLAKDLMKDVPDIKDVSYEDVTDEQAEGS